MQVDKISIANSSYNTPQKTTFSGCLFDDKVVKRVIESKNSKKVKLNFLQRFFGSERTFFLNAKGKDVSQEYFEYDSFYGKFISNMGDLAKYRPNRTIYRFTEDKSHILSAEKMHFDKHNRLRMHQFISSNDGLEKTIFRSYGPDGKETSYTVKVVNPETGKVVERVTYDSNDGTVLMRTNKDGKFVLYAEKGEFATFLRHDGELRGRIVDEDAIYHLEKENFSFLERYNINRIDNNKLMAFLKAIVPNKNQSRVVCYKFDRNYRYVGKTSLARDVSIENILILHRNGILKEFSYSKDFK